MRSKSAKTLIKYSLDHFSREPGELSKSENEETICITEPRLNIKERELKPMEILEKRASSVNESAMPSYCVFKTKFDKPESNEFRFENENAKISLQYVKNEEQAQTQRFRRSVNNKATQSGCASEIDVINYETFNNSEKEEIKQLKVVQGTHSYDLEIKPYQDRCKSCTRAFKSTVRGTISKYYFYENLKSNTFQKEQEFIRHVNDFEALANEENNSVFKEISAQKTREKLELNEYDEKIAEYNKQLLSNQMEYELPTTKSSVDEISEKEAEILFSKFLSSDIASQVEAANEIQIILEEFLDIIFYKDFGATRFNELSSKIQKPSYYLSVNVSIMSKLQQEMFYNVISKKLYYTKDEFFKSMFALCYETPLEQVFSELKIADKCYFERLEFSTIFQIFTFLQLNCNFEQFSVLEEKCCLYNAISSMSILSESLFCQAEKDQEEGSAFSNIILEFLIVMEMKSLADSYEEFTVANTKRLEEDEFKVISDVEIFGADKQKKLKNEQLEFSLYEIITQNICKYNFEKQEYVYNNQPLTYMHKSIPCELSDAVFMYIKYHWEHFFNTSNQEMVEYTSGSLLPRFEIACNLLIQIIKGELLSQSTNKVIPAAFYGVEPRNLLDFVYAYELLIQLFLIFVSNEFAYIYVKRLVIGSHDFLVAEYVTQASYFLQEILLINFMLIGNDEKAYAVSNVDVSKIYSRNNKSYCAYTSLGREKDLEIAKSLVFSSIETLYIKINGNQICEQKLFSILEANDIIGERAAKCSENSEFLQLLMENNILSPQ